MFYVGDIKMIKHKDIFGRIWELRKCRLCPICGQPDDFSDCNHKKLTNAEVKTITGVK